MSTRYFALVMIMAGCSNAHDNAGVGFTKQTTIYPTDVTMKVLESETFHTSHDYYQPNTTTWTSSDLSIVRLGNHVPLVYGSTDQITATCLAQGSVMLKAASDYFEDASTTITCTGAVPTLLNLSVYPIAPPTPPNAPAVSLEVGQSTTLGVIVSAPSSSGRPIGPAVSSAEAPTITFASDNTAVASVNSQGTITGASVGTATVTVTATDGNASGSAKVNVKVDAATTPTILITPNPVNLTVGGTQQLVLTANGAAATTTGFVSFDNTVISVDPLGGVVTAIGPGSQVVTSGAKVNGTNFSGGATLVNVSGPAATCASSGSYTFTTGVLSDNYLSNTFVINMPTSVALSFTITGSTMTVSGPPPFVGGTGTIDATCHVSFTATGSVQGVPNVGVLLTGYFPATGKAKLVYEVGTNGSMPRNRPVFYSFVK